MRQASSSYSLSLPCHLLTCCIFPCHHLHFICMFFKTCIRSGSAGSLRCLFGVENTLTHARRTSQIVFREREKNVHGMGRDLPSGLGIAPVDRPSNFVPFGGRLMPQRLTELTESLFSLQPSTSSHSPPSPSKPSPCSPPFDHDRVG